jgi:hypothetical protein
VATAEFTEREYELQFNLELASGLMGTVWTSGQVLEAIVGYDAVANPLQHHIIWRILQVPRPSSIHLAPHHWLGSPKPSAPDLPSQPISLVLQYKRPEYLRGPPARQWGHWRQPYFRFTRARTQHSTLRRLQRGLAAAAVVRYAAPAFWTRAELETNAMARSVIENSGFVGPDSLGRHHVWTYRAPGIEGFGNPRGRRIQFASLEELRGLLAQQIESVDLVATTGEGLLAHLAEAGTVSRRREPWLRADLQVFEGNLAAAEIQLTRASLSAIVNLASITSLTARIAASWHLAARPTSPTGT